MPSIRIRAYEPDTDRPPAYDLWQSALGPLWPLSLAAFHQVTLDPRAYHPGDHFVAEADAQIIGFAATQVRVIPGSASTRGEVMLLMVAPAFQRRGIGRALLDRALTSLTARKVSQVQLGAGGISYFWPGVPENLPGAWPFFEACGWSSEGPIFDLVRPLQGYETPPYVFERTRQAGITVATAELAEIPAILRFEEHHFPGWLHHYQSVVQSGAVTDVVLARTSEQEVVGASSVLYPYPAWRPQPFLWEQVLGPQTGGVGPLGVREDMQRQGIGLALAARVTELLQERRLAASFVGYTWLVDWYGKLGYQVWREYRMSRREV